MDSSRNVALAMVADMQGLEVQASNLAHVLTPGHKRLVFARVLDSTPAGRGTHAVSSRDFRQGSFQRTGDSLDLALEGAGFLVFETPEGPRFGRAGRLAVSSDGVLADPEGHPLLGEGGPIRIRPGASFTVDDRGEVRGPDGVLGRLQRVRFDDPRLLHGVGGGLFEAPAGMEAIPDGATAIRQGCLEGSNVEAPEEMVELMGNARHLESCAQAFRVLERSYAALLRQGS